LLTAATESSDAPQVADAVRSCLVLSEKIPVAVNCFVVPIAMLGLAGVTSIEASVADVTVRVALPEIDPDVALIRVEPTTTDVARPFEPAALLTAAMVASAALHVTEAVRSCLVLSEKIPVACNCCVVPSAILGLAGVISIAARPVGELPPPPQLTRRLNNRIPHIRLKNIFNEFFIATSSFFLIAPLPSIVLKNDYKHFLDVCQQKNVKT
jgi:hypothetical protein